LLRAVAVPTFVGGVILAVSGVVARSRASTACLQNTPPKVPPSSCTLLGSSDLWVLPPFLVWLWGGMAAVAAGLLIWVSADAVLRRAVLGVGIVAHLSPAAMVVIALFCGAPARRPSPAVMARVVVCGTLAAGLAWLGKRRADASALVFGVDLP